MVDWRGGGAGDFLHGKGVVEWPAWRASRTMAEYTFCNIGRGKAVEEPMGERDWNGADGVVEFVKQL